MPTHLLLFPFLPKNFAVLKTDLLHVLGFNVGGFLTKTQVFQCPGAGTGEKGLGMADMLAALQRESRCLSAKHFLSSSGAVCP